MNTRAEKDTSVRIEVTETVDGLHGGPEVWVKVLSAEVLDWPRVADKLDEEDHQALRGKSLLRYIPHYVTEEERMEHGCLVEEWFIWGVRA